MSTDSDCEPSLDLYQVEVIRAMEQAAITQQGMSEQALMLRAGQGALVALRQYFPNAQRIMIVCGAGNNAGDGFILARLAHQAGYHVTCVHVCALDQVKAGPARDAAIACAEAGVTTTPFNEQITCDADIVVDALLGIGLTGGVTGAYCNAIHMINAWRAPVLALDVSSGLHADTGEVQGAAVKADVTIQFIAAKCGLYTYQGPAFSGLRLLDDLNVERTIFQQFRQYARLICKEDIRPLLPRRCRSAHKGSFGHVLVVGGDYGMGGAVRMAAEAAMRVGAGLVSVATRPEHVSVVSGTRPEIMCHDVRCVDDIKPLVDRASVLVLGPGLGQSEWSHSLYDYLITVSKPTVMDADALNLLSEQPRASDHWVLTPHPGEAGRLMQLPCTEVQKQRYQCVAQLQQRYGGVAVLKGAGSLIASSEQATRVCTLGNPGMATAGMGDILSGIIGGLLAQHLSLWQAASAGVFIHARAADKAAIEGGERGLLATDLLKYLREMVNDL